jgi:hypothetical protein
MAHDWKTPPRQAEREAVEEMRAIGRAPTAAGVQRLLQLSRDPPSPRLATMAIDCLRLMILRGRIGDPGVRDALAVAAAALRSRRDLDSDAEASRMREQFLAAMPRVEAAARQVVPKDLEDPASLSAYLDALDERMKVAGVEIGIRPLEAQRIISEERQLDIPFRDPFAASVEAWFGARYGDRLKMDFTVGRMLVMVRGDPYVAKFPLVYGTVTLNLMQVIEGTTDASLRSLPAPELAALTTLVRRGFDAFNLLSSTPREVLADWDAAVAQAIARHPHRGLSKWSSHQAVEKMLNRFITQKGGDPKQVMRARKKGTHQHSLEPMVDEAERLGLPPLDRKQLADVSCTANVRYAERPEAQAVTAAQAVEANQASVFLCEAIAKRL